MSKSAFWYSCTSGRQNPYNERVLENIIVKLTKPYYSSYYSLSANPPNSKTELLAAIFTQLKRIGKILSSLISGRRGSNSRHPPWQGGILPLNYPRLFRVLSYYYMLNFKLQVFSLFSC